MSLEGEEVETVVGVRISVGHRWGAPEGEEEIKLLMRGRIKVSHGI